MKLELKTSMLKDGKISIELINSEFKKVNTWIYDTKEQSLRTALIRLGWTPPKEVK